MKLPNADLAVIPDQKVINYLLDEFHPQNKGKAKFYKMVGYTTDNPELLNEALKTLAQNGDVTGIEPTARGTKYVVEGPINAPNDRTYQLTSVWMIQATQNEPRLVTAYPKK